MVAYRRSAGSAWSAAEASCLRRGALLFDGCCWGARLRVGIAALRCECSGGAAPLESRSADAVGPGVTLALVPMLLPRVAPGDLLRVLRFLTFQCSPWALPSESLMALSGAR